MRTEVQIDGIHYTARSARELRQRGDTFSTAAGKAAETAGKLKGLADRIEAELNKPEPLVGGDIVRYTPYPEKGLMLVIGPGSLNDACGARWRSVREQVRATNGVDTYSGPASQFIKVGNINDGAK